MVDDILGSAYPTVLVNGAVAAFAAGNPNTAR